MKIQGTEWLALLQYRIEIAAIIPTIPNHVLRGLPQSSPPEKNKNLM